MLVCSFVPVSFCIFDYFYWDFLHFCIFVLRLLVFRRLFCNSCLENVPSFFSLNLLGTGLLYIMMNSFFMSMHHLVCHLDLNEMETDKVAALSLRWIYQLTFISKFWRNFPFDLPSILEILSDISSPTLLFTLHVLCLSLEYFAMFSAYIFIINIYSPISREVKATRQWNFIS